MGAFVYNSQDGIVGRYTSNGGYYVTGTALNDTIVNGGYYDSYDYYSLQADHHHRGDNVSINGWEGSDEILNHGDKVYIYGGTGNDSIKNHWGRNVTICGGKDDDTIICEKNIYNNQKELILYEPDDGNDIIYNFFDEKGQGTPEDSDYECIYIGSGDVSDTSKVDDSYFDGSDFVLKIGNGSITLKDAKGKRFEIQDNYNNGGRGIYTKVKVLKDSSDTTPSSDDTLSHDDNVIYGTPNDDTLENPRDKVKIEALAGNDDITNNGKSVTINGGEDKDSIKNFGSNTKINGDNGNDWIYNENANEVTIDSSSGNDYISNGSNAGNAAGSNVLIDSGEGDDIVWNAGNNALIKLGKGKDKIENYGNKVTIDSSDDNDTILNYGTNVSIKSGNGDDTLSAETGERSTLYGEEGNDVIYLYDTKTKVFGGKGDDTIRIESLSDKATVNGDEDSDTFVLNLSTQNGQSRTGNSAVIQDYESGKDKIVLEETSIDSYSIDGSDVILTLKSENISEYKLTLKNTKDKEITFTDSDRNTTTQIYREETIQPEDEEDAYWTLKDLETLLDGLNEFIPAIPKLNEILDVSARVSSILDSVISIAKGEKKGSDLKAELTKIAGDITGIMGDVRGLKGKDNTLWALSSTAIEGAGSYIAAFDLDNVPATKEEKEKLQKKINNAVEDSVDLANETLGVILNKFLENIGSLSTGEINKITKEIKSRYLRPAFSCLMVGYYGANQYRESIKDYNSQELPVALVAEGTFVDVLTSAVYGGLHQLTGKLDDLFVKTVVWVGFKIRGIEPKPIFNDKNYMELIAEIVKNRIFNSTNQADVTKINRPNKTHYAQDGDDYISNVFSNVRIYGGDGNDTIFSHGGARGNYLNGNNDRDYIIANDTKSTVIGDSGNDMLMSSGDGNSISGGDGIDFILLTEDASENTVNGGANDDIISLENSKNTVIYYVKGDGNDIIFGCDSDDTIHIAGKTKYMVTENGQDVYITVGNNIITLKDAAGKNVKIENRDTADNPIDDINPFEANPIISNTISRISARETENVVTDINSLNDLTENGTSILTFTENSGRGIQNVNLSSSEYPQVVSLEGGNQNVQFNDQNGNVAIVGNNATGWKDIIFGKGDNLGLFFSPKAKINTALGSGRDSVLVDNNAKVILDMSNSGATKIVPYSGSVTLDNYDALTGAAIQTEVNDLAKAIKEGSIQLIGNEVQLNPASSVIIKDAFDDSTLVNLIASDDTVQTVWFTGNKLGSIDAKELEGDLLLKSSYITKSSDLQKIKPSTLISGKGNDTIFAGARAFVDAGAGDNLIYLTSSRLRQNKRGATIASVEEGQTTVYGFNTGFEKTSDVLFFDKVDATDFNFDGTNLIVSNDKGAKTTLSNVAKDTPFVQILVADETGLLKTDIAKETATITVDDLSANAYIGKNSGVDFSNVTKTLLVNLSESIDNSNTSELMFEGITQVTAGGGYSSLIGSEANETLSAGTGNTSIWSGGGNDSMVGMGDSTDKKGRTTFFFLAGDGYDTIDNFTFLTPENSSSNLDDKIDITADNEVTNVRIAGNDVVVQINGSNDYLTLKEAVGKDFRINDRIAKVDQNIAYDGLANCYVASGGSSLTVDSSVDSAEIWLDNSRGTLFLGKIFTLDASAVKGNTSLVGNDFNNTIIAGQGDSSLWGGSSSSNDLLIGGKSQNTFFYFMDNGRDTIQGANNGDKVILDNISLDQIISTNITADAVFINFNDGGSLKVDGQSDVTYQLADGSKYSASYERLQWDSK